MSDKSIAQRLYIKEGYKVLLVNAPENYRKALGALPKNAKLVGKLDDSVDLVQLFVANKRDLEKQVARLKPNLTPRVVVWISYLKGTAKTKTDINRDSLHAYCKTVGLNGVSLVSIDHDWSAMRFKVS